MKSSETAFSVKGSTYLKTVNEAVKLAEDILTVGDKKKMFFFEKYGSDFKIDRKNPELSNADGY